MSSPKPRPRRWPAIGSLVLVRWEDHSEPTRRLRDTAEEREEAEPLVLEIVGWLVARKRGRKACIHIAAERALDYDLWRCSSTILARDVLMVVTIAGP